MGTADPKAWRPIEKKSLDRFIPMYNVAVNLCTKMNDNRFTFILLFDCRTKSHHDQPKTNINDSVTSGDYLSLYAVRTFVDADAKRVKAMLDYAYFEVIGRISRDNKTYLDHYLHEAWCKRMKLTNMNRLPLILPSIYCYLFDPSRYCLDDLLVHYEQAPVLPVLTAEWQLFEVQIKHYLSSTHFTDDKTQLTQLMTSERKGHARFPYEESALIKKLLEPNRSEAVNQESDSLSPLDSYFAADVSKKPPSSSNEEVDRLIEQVSIVTNTGVDYDQFVHRLNLTKQQLVSDCDDGRLREWCHILHLCDRQLFSHLRLQRDYPEGRDHCYKQLTEGLVATLSIQYFCSRNKINDIIRHVFITNSPKKYAMENRYLRNYASYCEWHDYVEVNVALKLAASLCFSDIMLEWLDNEIVSTAFLQYCRDVLSTQLYLVPSHHSAAPSVLNHTLTDFNFQYFFVSSTPINDQSRLPKCDFSTHYQAWCNILRRHTTMKSNPLAAQKRRFLINLADILPAKKSSRYTLDHRHPSTSHQSSDLVTKKRTSDKVKWFFVVDQKIYGKSPPNPVVDKDGNIIATVHDLDRNTLTEQANINIVSFSDRDPFNSAAVKTWESLFDINQKKKKKASRATARMNKYDANQPTTNVSTEKEPFQLTPSRVSIPTIADLFQDFQGLDTLRSNQHLAIEQLLFLEIFLTCGQSNYAILINGNPGTGKTTVMMHLIRHFYSRLICLLPTKILRERIINLIELTLANSSTKPIPSGRYPVMTFSALIKRLMRYRSSPQYYSNIIQRYLTLQLQRLYHILRPPFISCDFRARDEDELEDERKAFMGLSYPNIAFIDEYNLIDWHQHFLMAEAFKMLRVTRVLYGDSGQSAPINSTHDNAEMIALKCSLTIQFIDNRRLLGNGCPLRTLLSDSIWNWRSNSDNGNVCRYVRSLLSKHLTPLINDRVTIHGLNDWFIATASLLDWYDARPCRRYLASVNDMCQLLNRLPLLSLPCIITLRNRECDRANYWITRAIYDYTLQRCNELKQQQTANHSSRHCVDNYCLVVRRNAYAKSTAYADNQDIIETKVATSRYRQGVIADDPWCANLTLIIGAVYRFIGYSTLIQRDSLLQLVAFLPENDNRLVPAYHCNLLSCTICLRDANTKKKAGSPTKGCGAPQQFDLLGHKWTMTGSLPRLLMRRVYGESVNKRYHYVDRSEESQRQSEGDQPTTAPPDQSDQSVQLIHNSYGFKDLFILKRAYYTLTRCSSVWTPTLYNMKHTRDGMSLYGYPLELNAAATSYRVQGETIADTDVYIDFERMGKEQALVALSRVRRMEQIHGVINIDQFGRS